MVLLYNSKSRKIYINRIIFPLKYRLKRDLLIPIYSFPFEYFSFFLEYYFCNNNNIYHHNNTKKCYFFERIIENDPHRYPCGMKYIVVDTIKSYYIVYPNRFSEPDLNQEARFINVELNYPVIYIIYLA